MSTPPLNPGNPPPEHTQPSGHPESRAPRSSRRRTLRIAAAIAVWTFVALAILVGALAWYASTPRFEKRVRHAVIARLQSATGGRVQLGRLTWSLAHLQITAHNLTIHGTEGPGQVPYAHIDLLRARLEILSFFSPKIGLRDLQVDHPVFHLIVYPDGHTNQPRPKTPSSTSSITRIFDLQIGNTVVSRGLILLNDRKIPFDLSAHNLAAQFSYVPIDQHYVGTIHAEDLVLRRGHAASIHSALDATLDFSPSLARLVYLQLRTRSHSKSKKETVIRISGRLTNFADPHFQFNIQGAIDARELRDLAGLTSLQGGIAQIDATGQGTRSHFSVQGHAGITGGAFRKGTVLLSGVSATAEAHVTQNRIDVTGIRARLATGGAISGSLSLANWHQPAGQPHPQPPTGQIHAQVSALRLDSILDMVAPAQFRRLGFNTAATGTADLHWTGSPSNLIAQLHVALAPPPGSGPAPVPAPPALKNVSAPAASPAFEVPASGRVDLTYNQRTGTANIQRLQLHTPGSTIDISGSLGAYPLTRASQIKISLVTSNLSEFDSVLSTLGIHSHGHSTPIPAHLHGSAEFHGTLTGSISDPDFQGHLQATNFDLTPRSISPAAQSIRSIRFDRLTTDASYSAGSLSIANATLLQGPTVIHLSASIQGNPHKPRQIFSPSSTLQASIRVQHAEIARWIALLGKTYPVSGNLSLQAQLAGTLGDPRGAGSLRLVGGSAWGENYRSLAAAFAVHGQEISARRLLFFIDHGQVAGNAAFNYATKAIAFDLQGSGFSLSHIPRIQNAKYPVTGSFTFHARASGTLQEPGLQASFHVRNLSLAHQSSGFIDAEAHTTGRNLLVHMDAHLDSASISLDSQTALYGNLQTRATLALAHFDIDPILRTFSVTQVKGSSDIGADIALAGPLRHPKQLSGEFRVSRFGLTLEQVPLHSVGAIHAVLTDGTLRLDPVHIVGPDTDLSAQGSVGLFSAPQPLDATATGAVNMALAETLDPDLDASGRVDFTVAAHGTTKSPGLTGNVKFADVNVSLQDITNGLSRMNGNLVFDQDRLDFSDVTAYSGGGLIRVGGFVTYRRGLYADLTATAHDVRIRYPQGITSTADAKLRFQGTRASMLLSGHVLLTGFSVSPTIDFAALTSSTSGISLPPNPNAPSNHVRLDIHIASAPSLNFQNSFARLAGNVDLTIRGTLAQPTVLGRVTITEGTATFNGEKFQLQHGEIYFSNPIRIQPIIDITATTRVEDYNITIALQGNTSKLTPTFRSEPPLSEQDIFSLLAMGRTQEELQIYNNEQQQAGVNSAADALLGGALNATISNRIQKLFGGGSVRIDPTFATGIGNATARITITEPISNRATLTYATNVNATAEQLIQGEWRITQNFSILAVRDEAGVFSLIFRLHRRYY